MSEQLIEKIKEILTSTPLDIYSEESDTVNEANFELVASRFTKDSLSEEDRYVGSANMFIAASLVCYDYFDFATIDDLSEEELNEFYLVWKDVVEVLKKDRFIREIGLLSKNNIKVVVDNTKLP
jgi:hypothetical protein